MRRALSSNKVKFVNGKLPKPAASNSLFDSWEQCYNIAVSWITMTLSTQISQSTIGIDNARDLWLNLEERFSQGNHFRISNVLQELHSMRLLFSLM